MTGDHPRLGDNPGAKAVYDIDAIQLMKLASDFSRGINIHGKPLKKHPSFFTGGVINPFYEPLELELLKVRKKIIAGARFFQTQPFFDMETVDVFLEAAKPLDTKILIGVTPLKSVQMIDFLNENVLTKPIPESVKNRMVSAADPAEEGFRIAADFIDGIRGKADGVHLMPIGQISKLPVLLEMIEE
jgi:5,10-methylenetetrahydrofolate reductase